jgi:hypothetical protein
LQHSNQAAALPASTLMQVERYFRLNGVLPSVSYWIGAERPSVSDPFSLSDGSSVPQVGAAGWQ